ncbi:hypothetical protein F2L98_08010 [Campylobacter coli]|nr:hypothetical protein [Campylobacter coli]
MSNKVIINKQEVQFGTQDNQIFCTSLDVAKVFGKRHDHVLRDIENILNDLREIGTSQDLLNFGEVVRISKTTLGDKEAVADLQTLLERHPEMFQNKEQVANLIKKVIHDPEIIINNPTPKSEKDYIAGKKLNEKKMGEVGIRKDENISKIFHANEKRIKNLELMAKKDVVVDGRNAHTSYTQAQSLDGRLVQKNISSATNKIIPQQNKSANDFKAKLEEFSTKKTNAVKSINKEFKR